MSNIKIAESVGYFKSNNKISICWRKWIPDEKVKANIVIVHGIIEHSECYEYMAKVFNKNGFGVFAIDNRGFGRSDSYKGHCDDFSNFVKDLKIFIADIVKEESGNIPIILYGHSMGSIISMNYLKDNPDYIAGVILSGTGYSMTLLARMAIGVAKLLALISPKIYIKTPYWRSLACSYEKIAYDVFYDKNSRRKLTVGLYIQIKKGLDNFVAEEKNIKVPALILCGKKDLLFAKREKLLNKIDSDDKTVKIYKNCKHELFKENDKERNIIINDFIEWVNLHC